jgi:MarR family transcriptional regulator, organic hydroperoxide resistance regulator
MTLTPSDLLCFSLYSTSHAMQRAYAPLLGPVGLTYPQYLVLLTLWTEAEQTVGQISRALQLESNTLTPLLKRLEAQGLVQRHRSTRDERQVIVTLTPKGQKMESALRHVPDCIAQRSGMDQPALKALRDQILGLRQAIDRPG